MGRHQPALAATPMPLTNSSNHRSRIRGFHRDMQRHHSTSAVKEPSHFRTTIDSSNIENEISLNLIRQIYPIISLSQKYTSNFYSFILPDELWNILKFLPDFFGILIKITQNLYINL